MHVSKLWSLVQQMQRLGLAVYGVPLAELRHDTRNMDDGQRLAKAIRALDGKRCVGERLLLARRISVLPMQPSAPFED